MSLIRTLINNQYRGPPGIRNLQGELERFIAGDWEIRINESCGGNLIGEHGFIIKHLIGGPGFAKSRRAGNSDNRVILRQVLQHGVCRLFKSPPLVRRIRWLEISDDLGCWDESRSIAANPRHSCYFDRT